MAARGASHGLKLLNRNAKPRIHQCTKITKGEYIPLGVLCVLVVLACLYLGACASAGSGGGLYKRVLPIRSCNEQMSQSWLGQGAAAVGVVTVFKKMCGILSFVEGRVADCLSKQGFSTMRQSRNESEKPRITRNTRVNAGCRRKRDVSSTEFALPPSCVFRDAMNVIVEFRRKRQMSESAIGRSGRAG